MKFILVILILLSVSGTANSNPMHGFPVEFKVSSLWEQLVIDGRPTRAYRFVASTTFDDATRKITQWLTQASSLPQQQTKNGWVYISHRNGDTWTSVQLRPIGVGSRGSTVEGVVSFWQESDGSSDRFDARFTTLGNMQVIRRLESIDRGHRAITITAIGNGGIEAISESLAGDMKRLGLKPATFAPPSLRGGSANAASKHEFAAQAWMGSGRQVLFSVFEHRGRTAAQIYVLGGKHANE